MLKAEKGLISKKIINERLKILIGSISRSSSFPKPKIISIIVALISDGLGPTINRYKSIIAQPKIHFNVFHGIGVKIKTTNR